MPIVERIKSKATVNKVPSGTAAKGVVSRITPLRVLDESLNVLVYGRSGSGKTTFWSTFPGRTLVLLCSGAGGAGEIKSINVGVEAHRMDQVIIHESEEVLEICQHQLDLKHRPDSTKPPYDNIVLDHITGLQDLVFKEVLGLDEIPVSKHNRDGWGLASIPQYGIVTLRVKNYVKAMFDLTCNVVIVAQERDFNREESASAGALGPCIGPSVMPRLAEWLNPATDYIVHTCLREEIITKQKVNPVSKKVLTVKKRTGKMAYCLRVGPDEHFITKLRVPRGSPVPHMIYDPDYEKLVRVLRGEWSEGAA